jgi:hypothetical protein
MESPFWSFLMDKCVFAPKGHRQDDLLPGDPQGRTCVPAPPPPPPPPPGASPRGAAMLRAAAALSDGGAPHRYCAAAPPSSRTDWTRLVPPPVQILRGHVRCHRPRPGRRRTPARPPAPRRAHPPRHRRPACFQAAPSPARPSARGARGVDARWGGRNGRPPGRDRSGHAGAGLGLRGVRGRAPSA